MVVCGVGVRRGVVVVRPFSGGRHGHVARRAGGDRGAHASRFRRARASGAGDAVNGKYEKKTVTARILAHISERSDKVPRYEGTFEGTFVPHKDINER